MNIVRNWGTPNTPKNKLNIITLEQRTEKKFHDAFDFPAIEN